jgi:uncharacterized membrane protein YcaP (DUF421 family)
MDSVVRVVVMYLFLLVVFRLSGKQTLSEATTFDLLMLLVISETTQQAMVDDDHSMTNAFVLVLTFVAMNIGLSLWKQRSRVMDKVIDDVPLLILADGKMMQDRMDKERVDVSEILEAARQAHGLERLEQIKYAVLERNGKISVVPREG